MGHFYDNVLLIVLCAFLFSNIAADPVPVFNSIGFVHMRKAVSGVRCLHTVVYV